jgi:hypothetical protein
MIHIAFDGERHIYKNGLSIVFYSRNDIFNTGCKIAFKTKKWGYVKYFRRRNYVATQPEWGKRTQWSFNSYFVRFDSPEQKAYEEMQRLERIG